MDQVTSIHKVQKEFDTTNQVESVNLVEEDLSEEVRAKVASLVIQGDDRYLVVTAEFDQKGFGIPDSLLLVYEIE